MKQNSKGCKFNSPSTIPGHSFKPNHIISQDICHRMMIKIETWWLFRGNHREQCWEWPLQTVALFH